MSKKKSTYFFLVVRGAIAKDICIHVIFSMYVCISTHRLLRASTLKRSRKANKLKPAASILTSCHSLYWGCTS